MRQDWDKIKVLAVDLIGTLAKRVNATFAVRGSEYLAEHGYPIEPERFRRAYRTRYTEYSMGNYASEREFYAALACDLSINEWDPWLQALTELRIGYSKPFRDAQAFLEQVSRAYRLVLASNHVADWARRVVANARWDSYFHKRVISSECRFRKPSQQFFQEVLRVSGVAYPQEVLFIGDSLTNDVYGATNAGLRAVHVARHVEVYEGERHDRVPCVRSLLELVPRLAGEQVVASEERA